VDQMSLIQAILKELGDQGVLTMNARQYNAVIRGADTICDEMDTAHAEAEEGCGLAGWLRSDSTGLSSEYMAYVLFPGEAKAKLGTALYAHPIDAADFARCVRFVKAVPEARSRISEMADKSQQWNTVCKYWDKWEAGLDTQDVAKEIQTLMGFLPCGGQNDRSCS